MIAIVNMGPPPEITKDDASDLCRYEVRINREVITGFNHWRSDGLATCLRKAAEAVDRMGCEGVSIRELRR